MDVNVGTKPVDGYQHQISSEIPGVLCAAFGQQFGTDRGMGVLTNLDSGRPYPKPAMGALKSLAWKS